MKITLEMKRGIDFPKKVQDKKKYIENLKAVIRCKLALRKMDSIKIKLREK